MQLKRVISSLISSFARSSGTVLTILLLVGCATPHYLQESGDTYQGYEGPRLPPEQVATVDIFWGTTLSLARVLTIDGTEVNKPPKCYNSEGEETYHTVRFSHAELMPGKHTLVVDSATRKSGNGIALLQATLQPGHTYRIFTKHADHTLSPRNYPAWLVDLTTREVVAGPTEHSSSESWLGLEKLLKRMANEHATQGDVIEAIGFPLAMHWSMTKCLNGAFPEDVRLYNYQGVYKSFNDPAPDDTLVYHACRREDSPLIEYTSLVDSSSTVWSARYEGCGYLFIKFNPSDELQDYYFVAAPFNECNSSPVSIWDAVGGYIAIRTCRYLRKVLAYVDYNVQSGNPSQAYHALENSIINAHGNLSEITEFHRGDDDYSEKLKENVDQVTEDLIAEGRMLLKRYPEMFVSADNSFKEAAFTRSIEKHGDDAVRIERNRLDLYSRLVGSDRAEDAEHEFSNFFQATP